jgi:hypothetical protein
MIRPEDERAIEDLFDRLANVERNSDERDRDAEQLIFQRLRENPSAAYFMAQTIIVQEAALREQQKRIETLEGQSSQRSGGFLDGIFGDDRPAPRSQARRGPWGNVTGGVLLGSAIAGMFGGGGEANAAEADVPADPPAEDPGIDDGGGDWSDFDIGGDF